MIRLVCFDLDETLVDDNGVLAEALRRTCDWVASIEPALVAERLLKANGQIWRKFWPEVESQWTLGTLTGEEVTREAWRRTLLACGCADDDIARQAAETLDRLTQENCQLFDDVPDTLAILKGQVQLAVITNGAQDTQREKLLATAIEQHFDAIAISGELGVAKPNPAIFQHVLDELRLQPHAAIHVGDNLGADVLGAQAAHFRAGIWLNRHGQPRPPEGPSPDFEITSLRELVHIVERINNDERVRA